MKKLTNLVCAFMMVVASCAGVVLLNSCNDSSETNIYVSLQARQVGNTILLEWTCDGYDGSFDIYRNGDLIGSPYASFNSHTDYDPVAGMNNYELRANNTVLASTSCYYYGNNDSSNNSGFGNNDSGNNGGSGNNDSGNNSGNNDSGNNDSGNDDNNQQNEKPSAPTGVTASFTGSTMVPEIKIAWDRVNNAEGYYVYRASSEYGSFTKIDTKSSPYSTYTLDSNPLKGENYYKVKAYNDEGESEYSSCVKCEYNADASSPCKPTVTLRKSGSDLKVSWTIPTSNGCGKPTEIFVKVYHPISGVYYQLKQLSGTATSYTIEDYMQYNEAEYNRVRCTVTLSNQYGEGIGSAWWSTESDRQLQ